MNSPTLNELIDSVLHIVSGGRPSDDDLPERELVAQFWIDYRALFLRRDTQKNKFVSSTLEQDLGCIDLVSVDKAECCDVTTDCKILRTDVKIPRPIRLNDKDLFTYVGSIDKQHNWKIVRPYEARWEKYNKFTSKTTSVFYRNEYIYVLTNNTFLDKLNVRLVLYDPRDAKDFICDEQPCFTYDSLFPIPSDMIQPIRELIVTKELGLQMRIPTDITNDTIDNIQQGDKV